MTYQYKNKSDRLQMVIGHGVVKAGEVIETNSPIENPNFELINSNQDSSVIGTEAPQPNAVVEATPIQPDTEVK